MICNNCGADNPPTHKFCQDCGNALELSASPVETPSEALPPAVETPSETLAPAVETPIETSPPSVETPSESLPPSVETPSETPDEEPRREPQAVNNRILFIGAAAVGALALVCICCVVAFVVIAQPRVNLNLAGEISPTPRPSVTRRSLVVFTPTSDLPTPTLEITPTDGTPTLAASGSTPAPFRKWTPTQVANAFKTAGLEFTNSRAMTPDDYGSAPRNAAAGIRFFLPSLSGTKGGRIYSFSTNSNLQAMQNYYTSQSGAPPWLFVKDNILVQIHSDLPENRARQYQNALNSLR